METFFLVWNPNGRNPLFRHETAEKAKEEARRLCLQHPSETFFVLETLGKVSSQPVIEPKWEQAINMPF